jgi:fructose-specific phosphotransferase system IIC component
MIQEAILYLATWVLLFLSQWMKAVKEGFDKPILGSIVTASIWTVVLLSANFLTDFIRWMNEDEPEGYNTP